MLPCGQRHSTNDTSMPAARLSSGVLTVRHTEESLLFIPLLVCGTIFSSGYFLRSCKICTVCGREEAFLRSWFPWGLEVPTFWLCELVGLQWLTPARQSWQPAETAVCVLRDPDFSMEQELHPCFLRSPLLKKGKSVRLPTQVLTGGCRTGGATGDSQSAHFQYKAPLQALAFDVGWQHLQKDKKGSVVLPGTRVKFTGGERKKKRKMAQTAKLP